jgi:Fur family transcriptional regulator, ferric uptake regulator
MRRQGHRLTGGRAAVVRALAATRANLTAVQVQTAVADAGWSVDPTAVYRTLTLLAELGLAHILPTPGAHAYGFTDPLHHHAICEHCGEVREIPAQDVTDLVETATAINGYQVAPTGLAVHGVCSRCLTTPAPDPDPSAPTS